MARKSRVNQETIPIYKEKKKWSAGLYLRLSVEDGDDEEQNSIGNQKKIALHHLAETTDITLADTYSDHGYSGMIYNRPDFIRMMQDIRSGRINCVIVKDISRLGRHFILTSEYVDRIFPEMGVRLICINEDYDSSGENADSAALMMPLKMVMNDSYVKDISKKICSSIAAKMDKGEYLPSASSIPYGYVRNPEKTTYDIDPEVAAIVQRIFEMRAVGMKFNAIARQLNKENLPCPGKLRYMRGITKNKRYENALWIRGTIRKIVNDEVYLGYRIHGRVKRDKVGQEKKRREKSTWRVIENAHPAIISRALFDKVQLINQEELNTRKNFESRNEIAEDNRSILRDKVFCRDCESTMSGSKGCARENASTSSRVFFDCNNYKYSNHSRCCSHYIRQEDIIQKLSNLLSQQIKIAVELEKLVKDIENAPKVMAYQRTAKQEYASICMKRRNLEERIEQILMDHMNNVIDRSEYEYMKAQYSKRYEQLLEQEAKAAVEMRFLDDALDSTKKWIETIKRCQQEERITREIVDCLVNKIWVDSNKDIRVELNYIDPYQSLKECLDKIEVLQDVV